MSTHAHDNTVRSQAREWTGTAWDELAAVCAAEGAEVARDEPLARHTTMGVGGPTPLMFWPQHPEAVATILEWCAGRGLGWRVLGGGTNVLVSDAGVDEPVLNVTRLRDGGRFDADGATLPAGLPTAQALRAAIAKGLDGLVWTTGLPGTLGGAAAGNAGCWGGQMADVTTRLDVVDPHGVWQSIGAEQLSWSYRRLDLTGAIGAGTVIVAVTVRLEPADADSLTRRSDELQARKRESQPVGARNAGCIFKNPDPDTAAGMLIDKAGCKGLRVGDAEISEVHGNFLINRGHATAADIDALIARAAGTVRETLGVELEEEIHRW